MKTSMGMDLGQKGPFSMSGNTRHEDYCGDLSKVMIPVSVVRDVEVLCIGAVPLD